MSYRPSSLRPPTDDNDSNQQHHLSRSQSNGGSQLTPSQLRMRDKQRELEAFKKVLVQSQELVAFYEQFGDKFDVLGGGSEGAFRVLFLHCSATQDWKGTVKKSGADDVPCAQLLRVLSSTGRTSSA